MRHTALVVLTLLHLGARVAAAQRATETRRLATLGQVWGFLKYFHPGVAAGPIHWDSTLVAVVPRVRAARTDADFDLILASLLDAAGDVRSCAACRQDAPDSMRINVDFRWLTDRSRFGAEISRRLMYVRDNRHLGASRYVRFSVTPVFAGDTAWNDVASPAEGQRLLALFRFWNAMRYYFPYMNVNGGDWAAVLEEFIPRMIAASDARSYHLAVRELSTRIHDGHVDAYSPEILRALQRGGRPPWFEVRSIDGRAVVWQLRPGAPIDTSGVRVGDVITHIDGVPVAKRREELAKYVAAGNPSIFEAKLLRDMLMARTESVTYTVERHGVSLTRRIPTRGARIAPGRPLAEVAMMLPATNVGYMDLGVLLVPQLDSAWAIVRHADGIVLDLRGYPPGATLWPLAERLLPEARPFATATFADSTYPGQVVWRGPAYIGPRRPKADYYRGRIAILVDERTGSHPEYAAMALRTAPESRVIGSQTAGADGNVTSITLPGPVRVSFTGVGIYYPDGRPTQRVGVAVDIAIRPTLQGVRAGRDEVLERAIQYIQTGR